MNKISCIETNGNKYSDYSYDNSGRTLDDGVRQYEYNNAGRISRVLNGTNSGNYEYNALGQRVKKTANGQSIYFNYDESGQLIGEYDGSNNPIREYIYLGNQPIALFSSEKESEVLQIHTDHLGTPRVVTDKNKSVLWKMEGDQFGDVQPQVAEIKMPLRHAGQYNDTETGLFYNYYRYYDPKTGRYVTSDPIGLEGGLNTFGYVGGSPLSYTDPDGLHPAVGAFGTGWRIGRGINLAVEISTGSSIGSLAYDLANEDTCESEKCPPCSPYPKGTIGYQGPKTSVRGIHGTRAGTGEEHYIIFQVQQNPNDCKCRWQENKKLFGHHYLGQPQQGWINLNGRRRPPPYP